MPEDGPRLTVPPFDERPADTADVGDVCDGILDRLSDDQMKVTFHLWIWGVRETGVYARALGIENQPSEVKRREVKRQKDRLMKRLGRDLIIRRLASRLGSA